MIFMKYEILNFLNSCPFSLSHPPRSSHWADPVRFAASSANRLLKQRHFCRHSRGGDTMRGCTSALARGGIALPVNGAQ